MTKKKPKFTKQFPKVEVLAQSEILEAKNGARYYILAILITMGTKTQVKNISFFLDEDEGG